MKVDTAKKEHESMKKYISVLVMIVVLLSVFASALADYPVTVVDQAGRTVTIEAAPEKLVSGYYISTGALIALDADARLVGIEAKAGSRPIYRLAAPALLELPSVGTAKQFDLETCAALEPDLVILPKKLADVADTLADLGITALVVNPEDGALLADMIGMLAAALDVQEQGDALLAAMDAVTAALTEQLADCERPSVYLAGNSSLLSTAGPAMYQHSLIELAGGVNVAAGLTDAYWANIDYEQLLAWDPACIILASDASYTVADVLADAALAECTAVREGRVYQLPGSIEAWDSPVPGSVLGAMWMASVLHPEVIAAETYQETVKEFYGTFYQIDAEALPLE